jgi:hypothetical protein
MRIVALALMLSVLALFGGASSGHAPIPHVRTLLKERLWRATSSCPKTLLAFWIR